MKKKIIILLIILSLVIAMTGCNITVNKELDINNYSLKFGDIYLVNKNGFNIMVFGIKYNEALMDDTIISFYGISNGEEKLLNEYEMGLIERSGFGFSHNVSNSEGLSISVPAIENFNGVMETIQTCFIDWDGYDSYRVDIRMEDGDISEPKVLDTASYEIDSKDLIKVTEDEFKELRMAEILDSIESCQFEAHGLLVRYDGADITSTGYNNVTISIENKTVFPIVDYRCQIEIMDSYNNKSGIISVNNDEDIYINPGEVKKFSENLKTNVGLNIEAGKEYVVRVYIYDSFNNDVIVDAYVKSKFR